MTIEDAVQKCNILCCANIEIQKKIADIGHVYMQKRGVPIFREREEAGFLYFVIEGYVIMYRHNHNGDRKNIFIYSQGILLNEVILENPIASVSAEPLCDSLILKIPRGDFMEFMKDTDFSQAVFYSAAKKIRKLYHQLANTSNSFHLEQQVLSKLWKLARDFGVRDEKGIHIPFKISVTLLADMIGAKRESVSRTVGHLKKEGLIIYHNGIICILDTDLLLKKISDN